VALAGLAALAATAATILPAPAAAAPRRQAHWVVTDNTPPAVAPHAVPAPHDVGRIRSHLTDDTTFKQLCQQTPQAATHDGWAMDRFNQCFVGHRRIDLKVSPGAPTTLATVEFDYWLLVFPQPTSRTVTYKFGFDNWTESGGEVRATTTLAINLGICASDTSCSTSLTATKLLAAWSSNPTYTLTITSPTGVGAGPQARVADGHSLDMTVDSHRPDIIAWHEDNMLYTQTRFDSAGTNYAASADGAVVDTYSPIFLLHLSDATETQSAHHIDDAIHHPERTFPSFLGKSIPGGVDSGEALHRTLDKTTIENNRTAAKNICTDVWGSYDGTLLNCDEFPFASTQEGAASVTDVQQWRGSARLIRAADNQASGRRLNSQFYKPNRILDNDRFLVNVQP
jgi:hypothetical protein